jgi:hypothetical protein
MEENELAESCEFLAPYVRVRGRVSREWQVQWSPCIRTFKSPKQEEPDSAPTPAGPTRAAVGVKPVFSVGFLDYRSESLVSSVTEPHFLAKDQEWATFVARLPYHRETQSVVLSVNERVVGRLEVPSDRPYFSLLRPNEDDFIDPAGILHLHWADHECRQPLTYFVRYSHNGDDWLRPGVNLHCNDFYLDLGEMPGGPRCVVQVIATNGYRTSYVQTRRFDVTRNAPEVFLGPAEGPVLWAQGFSRQHGPITGESIVWRTDGGIEAGRGGSLDIRTLPAGNHQISVAVRDPDGQERVELAGRYDPALGRVLAPNISL